MTETVTEVQTPPTIAEPAVQTVQVGAFVAPLEQEEALKVALMVWLVVTLENIFEELAATVTPSTISEDILKPLLGVMVNDWSEA